jgi:hypothetical protein
VSCLACAAVALGIALLSNVRLGAGAWQLAPGFLRSASVAVAVACGLVAAVEAFGSRQPSLRPPRLARIAGAAALYALAALGTQAVFGPVGGASFGGGLVLVLLGSLTARLRWTPMRIAATYLAFLTAIYGIHQAVQRTMGPAQAPDFLRSVLVAAVLLAVWSSSTTIVARLDRAFHARLERLSTERSLT